MKKIAITPRFIAGDSVSAGSSAVDRLAIVDANNLMLTRAGALPLGLPLLQEQSGETRSESLRTIVDCCDGLLLQGGTDIEPSRYGEAPLRPEWAGDALRDRLEFDLVAAFLRADKPILGVCRGFQVLNVVFGGLLYQDLPSQHAENTRHDGPSYCGSTHEIQLSGELERCYEKSSGRVNSAHHQGIKRLGADLEAFAHAPDGLCEGFRSTRHGFVWAVQWHPEFHFRDVELLPAAPLLEAFLQAC